MIIYPDPIRVYPNDALSAETPMRKAKVPAAPEAPVDLGDLPGHYIRRLQQIAVAVFLQETESSGITPVQYAALQTVANVPGVDQRTLARTIGLDTSTIAAVIDRLEARGLMQRSASPDDRRVRLLSLTPDGREALQAVLPAMQRAQERILEPLPVAERAEFMRMLRTLVATNNELSRAPSDRPGH
jgi:MarR family transcriptional regulator, lower aerobic nicotinate degradation pathway regulator